MSDSIVVESTNGEVIVIEPTVIINQTTCAAEWGGISGNIGDQADLVAELDSKQPAGDYATSADLGNKVDKEDGKGLSTNDYTLTDRQKLAKIGSSSSTSATGDNATAIGDGTTASGARSFAGGYQTIASGFQSIAMGVNSQATNYCAMCFAINSIASGMSSFATGATVKAESMFSAAFGRFNVGGGNPNSWVGSDPLFEIGNGTSDAPANAFTVYKNGNARFSGTVTGADGKQLSKNDYTTPEKDKLAGIEAGAQVNVVPTWNIVTDKPSTFPPSSHEHSHNDLTGLNDGDYQHITQAEKTKLGSAVTSSTVAEIVTLTQAAYDALNPKVATTLYVITGV